MSNLNCRVIDFAQYKRSKNHQQNASEGSINREITTPQPQPLCAPDVTTCQTSEEAQVDPNLQCQTKNTTTIEKLERGYTRIPNTILMGIVSGNLSKAEIKIILLIARLTISYQERKYVSLSKSGIEKLTQLQGKAILQAIESLLEKGLIRKIPGNQYTSNQFGLCYEEDLFVEKRTKPNTTNQPDSNSTNSEQKSTYPADKKGTQGSDQKSTNYKQYALNQNLKTLSQEFQIPIEIHNYFQNTKSYKKREREWKHFELLLESHSTNEINLALSYLIEKGTPDTGDCCHSPMAYLSVSIQEVLTAANSLLEKKQKIDQQKSQQQIEQELLEAQKKQEELEFQIKLSAFKQAFPSSEKQESYIQQMISKYPFLTPTYPNLRDFVVLEWAKSLSLEEQQ